MQTRQLVGLLRDAGVRVDFVATNPPYRPRWLERIPWLRAAGRLLPYVYELWVRCGRVSVVHLMANSGLSWWLFALPALLVATLRRRPVIVNYRGGQAEQFIRRWWTLVRPTFSLATVIVVPSAFLEQVFRRAGFTPLVIPNIVDVERFPWRAPASEPLQRPHLVVTRNLEPIYDVATAIHIFAEVRQQWPGARLSIAGSGPDAEDLRALVARLGLADAVTFTGRLDRDGVAALYAQADVMLNTSLVDNMPNALLEAMAAGLPVVTTNAGGIPYIVEDGRQGLLFEPGDVQGGAALARRVLADRDLARRLSEAGRVSVEAYTWDAVRKQWEDLYRTLANHRGGAK